MRLRRTTRIQRLSTSFVVDIAVTSDDATKSARVANAIAATFVEDQRRLGMQITERANPSSTTRIISPATRPLERAGPGTALMLLLSGLMGLGGGTAFAAIREALDRRLRSHDDIETAIGLQCLGSIPLMRPQDPAPMAHAGDKAGLASAPPFGTIGMLRHVCDAPDSAFSEGLRMVRSVIEEWRHGGTALVIGFGAPWDGSGRTTIAANLALLMASAGQRTLLVDADAPVAGLTRAALSAPRHAMAQQPWRSPDGFLDFQPLCVSGSGAFRREQPSWLAALIEQEGRNYDFILVDLPSPGLSGDLRALTGPLDAVILVAEWGKAEAEQIMAVFRSVRHPEKERNSPCC